MEDFEAPNWKLYFTVFLALNVIAIFVPVKFQAIINSATNIFLLFFFILSFLDEEETAYIVKIWNKLFFF